MQQLCEAFCDSISVRTVPAGLAISTTVASIDGDPIGFYVRGPMQDGRYRIEDSGLLIPRLHALGADFENETRRDTFYGLLNEYGASYDEDSFELVSEAVIKSEVPGASLRFVTLLLRVGDLEFMAQEKAASTFKHDAAAQIKRLIGQRATIRESEPVSTDLSDWEPDMVLEAQGRDPVGVFFVQTDTRILEAMLLHTESLQKGIPASVVALLEKENSVSRKSGLKARNRLDAVPVYEGDESVAIGRVIREAVGREQYVH